MYASFSKLLWIYCKQLPQNRRAYTFMQKHLRATSEAATKALKIHACLRHPKRCGCFYMLPYVAISHLRKGFARSHKITNILLVIIQVPSQLFPNMHLIVIANANKGQPFLQKV